MSPPVNVRLSSDFVDQPPGVFAQQDEKDHQTEGEDNVGHQILRDPSIAVLNVENVAARSAGLVFQRALAEVSHFDWSSIPLFVLVDGCKKFTSFPYSCLFCRSLQHQQTHDIFNRLGILIL